VCIRGSAVIVTDQNWKNTGEQNASQDSCAHHIKYYDECSVNDSNKQAEQLRAWNVLAINNDLGYLVQIEKTAFRRQL
jgi:hypothetical protein